jgi:hypothetical protein
MRDGSDSKGSPGADYLTESFRERFESLSLSLGPLGFADPLGSTGIKDAFVPIAPRLPDVPPRLESSTMQSSPDPSKVPMPMSPLMSSPTGSSAGFFLPLGVLED